jgi:hypothetical protein
MPAGLVGGGRPAMPGKLVPGLSLVERELCWLAANLTVSLPA